jgi:putative transposase
MDGRLKNVRFACSAKALKRLTEYRQGESDPMFADGEWFLITTCEVPEAERYEPKGWIGVDRGINNLATTSDGDNYSGRRLTANRRCDPRPPPVWGGREHERSPSGPSRQARFFRTE